MSDYGVKNISEETVSQALKMVIEGYSYHLVAEEIGVSKGLISHWVKKAGVDATRKPKYRKKSTRQTEPKQNWNKIKKLLSQPQTKEGEL